MDTGTVLLLVLVVVAVGFAVYFFIQKERTQKLQTRFGPEYKHAVERFGDRAKAESDLQRRTARVEADQGRCHRGGVRLADRAPGRRSPRRHSAEGRHERWLDLVAAEGATSTRRCRICQTFRVGTFDTFGGIFGDWERR